MLGRSFFSALLIAAMCTALGGIIRAQEAGKSNESPSSTPENKDANRLPSDRDIPIGDVYPDQLPIWAKFKLSTEIDEVPAVTEAFSTEEEATRSLDSAAYTAIVDYLTMRTSDPQAAQRIGLSNADCRAPFIKQRKEQFFREGGDPNRTKLAVLFEVPDQTRKNWFERWQQKKQQSAISQVLFVGSGLLAAVAILAIQAKTNHATNGRRSGILRAAAAIAILTLFGGLTTAAFLGRIFSV